MLSHHATKPPAVIRPPGSQRAPNENNHETNRFIKHHAPSLGAVPHDGQNLLRMSFEGWSLYRLTRRMRAGVVRFAYEKADGTLRRACGTLQDIAATIKGTGRPDDGRTVKYYDIEAAGWRSFKVENLVTIY